MCTRHATDLSRDWAHLDILNGAPVSLDSAHLNELVAPTLLPQIRFARPPHLALLPRSLAQRRSGGDLSFQGSQATLLVLEVRTVYQFHQQVGHFLVCHKCLKCSQRLASQDLG